MDQLVLWLERRLNRFELKQLLYELRVESVEELIKIAPLPLVRQRLELEYKRRRTAADVYFTLDSQRSVGKSISKLYKGSTYVDKTHKEDLD